MERLAVERARTARLKEWIKARALLRTAVVEVETVLSPLGLYLGMADEGAHPVDLVVVEIRLYVHGRPCEASLDIVVSEDGRQFGCDAGGAGLAHRTALPDIARATAGHYRAAVLAYIERTSPACRTSMGPPCRLCGRHVREVDVGP